MLSDAISHSIVFGIVIVWLLTRQQAGPVQIIGAALAGVLTVFLSEALANTRKVKTDAAIGLVFPVLFAIGVLLLNLYARDVHIDTHTVLLGEIGFVWLDTLRLGPYDVPQALVWMGAMTILDLAFVVLFYKELKVSAFDPALAAALGFAPVALFYALLVLTSATAVAAFDAVGAVLFVAFVIVPPAAGYLLSDRLWRIMAYAAAISLASSLGGYALAVAWNVSIGGMMASLTGAFLLAAFLFGPRHGIIAQEVRKRGAAGAHRARALAVHLYNHELRPESRNENTVSALRGHLRWSEREVRRVLARAGGSGLIDRTGDRLHLTPRGRTVAQQIMEPWRAGEEKAQARPEDAGAGDSGANDARS